MASEPNFRKLSIQDFEKPPAFLAKLIAPINNFNQQVQQSYNKQFDFNNFRGDLVEVSFATPTNYDDGNNFNFINIEFQVTPATPRICLVGNIIIDSTSITFSNKPVTIPVGGWFSLKNNQIIIQYITGLQPNVNYKAIFVVF